MTKRKIRVDKFIEKKNERAEFYNKECFNITVDSYNKATDRHFASNNISLNREDAKRLRDELDKELRG